VFVSHWRPLVNTVETAEQRVFPGEARQLRLSSAEEGDFAEWLGPLGCRPLRTGERELRHAPRWTHSDGDAL